MPFDLMRDRQVYQVFHSTDEDAVDLLMESWQTVMQEHYPEGTITDAVLVDARRQAEDTVATVRDDSGYFVIGSDGKMRIVSPVDVASDWEDFDDGNGDLLHEVQVERRKQIEVYGYTPEHDDAEGPDHLIDIARSYVVTPSDQFTNQVLRRRVIKSMATLIALVELIDRAEAVEPSA